VANFDDIITNKGERTFGQVAAISGIRVQTPEMRPGHFYSFEAVYSNLNEYKIPRDKEEWSKHPENFVTEKQYVDVNPCGILLYHDNWKQHALVLDLKILPPVIRLKVLKGFYIITEKYLDKLYKDGKLLPFKDREKLILPFYGITVSMLQEVTRTKLNYSINKYNMEDIRNVQFIDWNVFGELPFANVDDRGVFLAPNYITIDDVFEQFEEKQY